MYIWIYALVIVAVATLIILFFVFREKRMKQLEQKILTQQNEEKPAEPKVSPAAKQKVKEKNKLKQKKTPLQPQAELKDENASQKDLKEEVASPKELKQEILLQNQRQTAELEDFSLDAEKNQTIEDEELRKYKKFLDETFDEFDKDFDEEQDEDDEQSLGDDFLEDDEDLAEQDSSLRERFGSRNGHHPFDDEDELQKEDDSMQDLSDEQFEEASKKFLESASKVDKALRGRAPDIRDILGEDDVLMADILKPKFDDDED